MMATDNQGRSKTDEDSLKEQVYTSEDLDLFAYYEEAAGRLVVDPEWVFRRLLDCDI